MNHVFYTRPRPVAILSLWIVGRFISLSKRISLEHLFAFDAPDTNLERVR